MKVSIFFSFNSIFPVLCIILIHTLADLLLTHANIEAERLLSCPDRCNCENNFANCEGLSLSDTDINSIGAFANISLKDNFLTKMPRFINASMIQELDLSGNNFNKVSSLSFTSLNQLRILKLQNNNISVLQTAAFYGLLNLEYLNLDNNSIANIFEGVFYKLEEQTFQITSLSLKRNLINKVSDLNIQSLTKLNNLDLEDNIIKKITHIRCITRLNLNGNNISIIDPEQIINNECLKELSLNSKEFDCSCDMKVLQDWLIEKNLTTNFTAQCKTPLSLLGKRFTELSPDDYDCEPEFSIALAPRKVEGILSTQTQKTSVDIRCEFNRGKYALPSTTLTFFWKYYNKRFYPARLANFAETSDHNSTTLHINLTKPDYAGIYRCVAENKTAKVKSDPIELSILFGPWIIGSPKNKSGKTDESVSNLCSVKGKPQPTISWKRVDGLPFLALQEKRLDLNGDYLIFNHLKHRDEGMYACNATSSIGTKIVKFYINITESERYIGKPEGQQYPTDVLDVLLHEREKCTKELSPDQIEYSLYESHTYNTLFIKDLEPEEEGYYECNSIKISLNQTGNFSFFVKSSASLPTFVKETDCTYTIFLWIITVLTVFVVTSTFWFTLIIISVCCRSKIYSKVVKTSIQPNVQLLKSHSPQTSDDLNYLDCRAGEEDNVGSSSLEPLSQHGVMFYDNCRIYNKQRCSIHNLSIGGTSEGKSQSPKSEMDNYSFTNLRQHSIVMDSLKISQERASSLPDFNKTL